MSTISSAGIAMAWVAERSDARQQAVALSVMKAQAESEAAVVTLLDDAAAQTPPPAPDGQGSRVDIQV